MSKPQYAKTTLEERMCTDGSCYNNHDIVAGHSELKNQHAGLDLLFDVSVCPLEILKCPYVTAKCFKYVVHKRF